MTNLPIRILVIVLKDSVAIRAILVLRYVCIVFGLVKVVRHRHYPSYVVDKATTERSRRKEKPILTNEQPTSLCYCCC